ncbi:hypothetical protein [Variovorax rhizosphaerae]|uniref:Uncharacterized protein n=1 Tax=Variovorax rhizosphaerae TaxID=1836200 RepID=A0ABU8WPR6_9BURK
MNKVSEEVRAARTASSCWSLPRRWLYDHRLLIVHDRAMRALIAAALLQLDARTAELIGAEVIAGPTGARSFRQNSSGRNAPTR